MVDLQQQYLTIKKEIDEAIQNVLSSAAFINGPQVQSFADNLAQFNNAKHVITCANGTDALQIAMMALDFKPGQEVIVPAFTYVATVEVIALLGLKPVFVDVDPQTFNIEVKQILSKLTDKTVGIVPVHLYGQCSDMESLLKIAKEHGIRIIEDGAQSLGAEYYFSNGTKAMSGTMGDIGTTSFFPSKNLGCFGDGGALFTNDDVLAEKLKMIANHGQKRKYYHEVIGVNSRLDTLQAALLDVKLKYLNAYKEARNKVADFYDSQFSSSTQVSIPYRSTHSSHVFHQYTLKLKNVDRQKLTEHLFSKNIPTMIYYPVPLHLQKAYMHYGYKQGDFPVSEELANSVISLPIHTEMDDEQLKYITSTILEFLK